MILEDNKLYVLFHDYEYGDDGFFDDEKVLGVYSSKKHVRKAIRYYKKLKGFKKYPRNSFSYFPFELNKHETWTKGFISGEEAAAD